MSSTASADFQAGVWTSMATSCSTSMTQHLGKKRTVDIAAGKHCCHLAAGDPAALLRDSGDARCAGAFRHVVRGLEDERDRLRYLVVAHLDDAIDVAADDFERRRVGLAHRHAIGEARR